MMYAARHVVLVLMLAAKRIHRLVGDAGASVISRVMGLTLATVAINSTLAEIKVYLEI